MHVDVDDIRDTLERLHRTWCWEQTWTHRLGNAVSGWRHAGLFWVTGL